MDPKFLCMKCKYKRVKCVDLKDKLLELSANEGLHNCFESTLQTTGLK